MNAYFQIITSMTGTAVKLVPETDGGAKLDFAELMEYLRLKNIEIADAKPLYQAVEGAILSSQQQWRFLFGKRSGNQRFKNE